jgi:hypothetical protein
MKTFEGAKLASFKRQKQKQELVGKQGMREKMRNMCLRLRFLKSGIGNKGSVREGS